MQASVCAPVTTSRPTPRSRELGLQGGVLEGVAVLLVHQRLGLLALQLGHVLPAVAVLGQVVVGVLHPDHRDLLGAGLVDQGVDVGDHLVALVGVGHHVVLHVHDQQGGVGTIWQAGHRVSSEVGGGEDDGLPVVLDQPSFHRRPPRSLGDDDVPSDAVGGAVARVVDVTGPGLEGAPPTRAGGRPDPNRASIAVSQRAMGGHEEQHLEPDHVVGVTPRLEPDPDAAARTRAMTPASTRRAASASRSDAVVRIEDVGQRERLDLRPQLAVELVAGRRS